MSDSIFCKGDRVRFLSDLNDMYPDEAEITGFAAAPHPLDGEWPVVTYERGDKSHSHQVHPSHLGAVVNRDIGRDRLRAAPMDDVTFAILPDVLKGDENANRLAKALLVYMEAHHAEHDDSVDPREGCSVMITYHPEQTPAFRIAAWPDPDLLTTLGFPVHSSHHMVAEHKED
jgi:hypothetical protein